jgi:hypothetical protein
VAGFYKDRYEILISPPAALLPGSPGFSPPEENSAGVATTCSQFRRGFASKVFLKRQSR